MNKQTNRRGTPLNRRWRGAGGEVILIFGAGKSATCLIDYMVKEAGMPISWQVTVADQRSGIGPVKTGNTRVHVNSGGRINVENAAAERNLSW